MWEKYFLANEPLRYCSYHDFMQDGNDFTMNETPQ